MKKGETKYPKVYRLLDTDGTYKESTHRDVWTNLRTIKGLITQWLSYNKIYNWMDEKHIIQCVTRIRRLMKLTVVEYSSKGIKTYPITDIYNFEEKFKDKGYSNFMVKYKEIQ